MLSNIWYLRMIPAVSTGAGNMDFGVGRLSHSSSSVNPEQKTDNNRWARLRHPVRANTQVVSHPQYFSHTEPLKRRPSVSFLLLLASQLTPPSWRLFQCPIIFTLNILVWKVFVLILKSVCAVNPNSLLRRRVLRVWPAINLCWVAKFLPARQFDQIQSNLWLNRTHRVVRRQNMIVAAGSTRVVG